MIRRFDWRSEMSWAAWWQCRCDRCGGMLVGGGWSPSVLPDGCCALGLSGGELFLFFDLKLLCWRWSVLLLTVTNHHETSAESWWWFVVPSFFFFKSAKRNCHETNKKNKVAIVIMVLSICLNLWFVFFEFHVIPYYRSWFKHLLLWYCLILRLTLLRWWWWCVCSEPKSIWLRLQVNCFVKNMAWLMSKNKKIEL